MAALRPLPRRDMSLLLTEVFPALRALARMGYFELSVEGTSLIPRHGPVVYVWNHSGWFALDAILGGLVLADSVGAERLPYGAVQDQLLKVPWVGRFFERIGGFPASWLRDPLDMPPEMQHFTIYPEGTEGNCKPFWRAYRMQAWRTGFARLAAARLARVVPVAAIGGEECLPVAMTLRTLKPLLGTILPVPLCLFPLPSRWKFIFHEPVDIEPLGAGPFSRDPASQERRYHQFAARVRATVQATLDRETADHRLARLARCVERHAGNSGTRDRHDTSDCSGVPGS
ncbi:1-acyl-sn-glycerol-3-phosphate acyltransferase [Sorangium sp. So ce448]|uniref:1-acyl-sn-glycerol-3-phosphate acyltransferase n=1 Tax=Sorangium sp. So ce448 TaxID=3133314 RepID=UPI003F5DC3D9